MRKLNDRAVCEDITFLAHVVYGALRNKTNSASVTTSTVLQGVVIYRRQFQRD